MDVNEIISSGLPELYVMGLTTAEETLQVEQWADQYPEIKAEIAAIESGLEEYARANAITPDASVKEKIFAQIKGQEAKAPVVTEMKTTGKLYTISPSWKYAAAASIILLIGSMFFNYRYYNKYETASTELQQQKDLAASMNKDMEGMHNDMNIMSDPKATPVSLDKTATAPDGAARIYWMKNTADVYIDPSYLAPAPPGKQYQFWGIVNGAPVSGGMINLEIGGKKVHLQKMKSFGKADAFAVSLEDAGPEKTKPTEVMVVGKVI
ncbi:MAG: anti-sigma factor [Ferruginibacter sp.]